MGIETVKDLIIALAEYPADKLVIGMWEEQLKPLMLYQSADGVVIVDADHGHDRDIYEEKEIKPAVEAYYERLNRNK